MSAAFVSCGKLPSPPLAPACEDRSATLVLRFHAPELCDDATTEARSSLDSKNSVSGDGSTTFEHGFALVLRSPAAKPLFLSRIIDKMICQLKVEGFEVEAFNTGVPANVKALDTRVDAALEAVELRKTYYKELRELMLKAADFVVKMRSQCLKELDRLRGQVSMLRQRQGQADAAPAADDVTFFSAADFLPPSWNQIMEALDELRWRRLTMGDKESSREGKFARLADTFSQQAFVTMKRSCQEVATQTDVGAEALNSIVRTSPRNGATLTAWMVESPEVGCTANVLETAPVGRSRRRPGPLEELGSDSSPGVARSSHVCCVGSSSSFHMSPRAAVHRTPTGCSGIGGDCLPTQTGSLRLPQTPLRGSVSASSPLAGAGGQAGPHLARKTMCLSPRHSLAFVANGGAASPRSAVTKIAPAVQTTGRASVAVQWSPRSSSCATNLASPLSRPRTPAEADSEPVASLDDFASCGGSGPATTRVNRPLVAFADLPCRSVTPSAKSVRSCRGQRPAPVQRLQRGLPPPLLRQQRPTPMSNELPSSCPLGSARQTLHALPVESCTTSATAQTKRHSAVLPGTVCPNVSQAVGLPVRPQLRLLPLEKR
eukprot:TRINITY_DN44059_c0_g1_i1.p1 TRINITY_DN44059_c0_g1~~TRINITY_DN44059_c0_g1_i1.p1  ORF type:complete len:613 (+),score=93.93 TRINITY_DN44059_c0_g1_i1:36-1841(+)